MLWSENPVWTESTTQHQLFLGRLILGYDTEDILGYDIKDCESNNLYVIKALRIKWF